MYKHAEFIKVLKDKLCDGEKQEYVYIVSGWMQCAEKMENFKGTQGQATLISEKRLNSEEFLRFFLFSHFIFLYAKKNR